MIFAQGLQREMFYEQQITPAFTDRAGFGFAEFHEHMARPVRRHRAGGKLRLLSACR